MQHLRILFRRFALGLLLLGGAVIASAQKPTDWAGYHVYAAANDTVTVAPEAVFMGNSLTEYWLQQRPEWFVEHSFAARGICGQTSAQMLCRFQADVISLHPKKVHIFAGINDIAQNLGPISLRHIADNILSMARLAMLSGIEPYVASVLPCNSIYWDESILPADSVVALNALLKADARHYGYTYIDYYPYFVDPKSSPAGGMQDDLTVDGVHLSSRGYAQLQDHALEALGEVAHIRLTFDDGLREHHSIVWPLLLRYGLHATFYVIGEHADKGTPEVGAKPMTWNMIARMSAQGQTIGNHTYSHKHMAQLSPREAAHEIMAGDSAIFVHTGIHPAAFAYPYNSRNDTTDHIVRSLLKAPAIRGGITLAVGGKEYPNHGDTRALIQDIVEHRRNVTFVIHGITTGWDAWSDREPFDAMMDEIAAQVKAGRLIVD